MDERAIKENLKVLRMRSGLSQDELGEAVNLSRVSYSKLETGRVRIINKHINAIAKVLNVLPEEILLGYVPDKDASVRLQTLSAQYDEDFKKQQKEFSAQLDTKETENATLRDLIQSLKDTIRNQEEIIKMLKRRIPEENA
jgi:transcriptional regulator with XRE-family HTH domain